MLVYLQMIETREERSTFEKLYLAYRDVMFHIANKILNNPEDAEDAVHNAFVAIAENIQKINDPHCPKTKGYIVTIVESKAIDIYRKKNRHPHLPLYEYAAVLTVEPFAGEGLARCFALLPAELRHILLLKYRYGYTNRELARLLHLSEANVIKRTQRAKEKLSQLCKEEGLQ